jgi:GNAT superfamily N-acetyltransferase
MTRITTTSDTGRLDIKVRRARIGDHPLIVRFNTSMARETENISLKLDSINAGVVAVLEDPTRGFYVMAEALVQPQEEGEIVSMDDDGMPVTISKPPPATIRTVGQLLITYEWSDWRCGDFWWIQSVYVEPQFRRQGVFQSMFEWVKRESEKRVDVVGMRLYAERNNRTARQTYEKLGMDGDRYIVYEIEKDPHRG